MFPLGLAGLPIGGVANAGPPLLCVGDAASLGDLNWTPRVGRCRRYEESRDAHQAS